MFKFTKWGVKKLRLMIAQRNLTGDTIASGEMVRIAMSKEDPSLIDIMSVEGPKRIIRNVPKTCVET